MLEIIVLWVVEAWRLGGNAMLTKRQICGLRIIVEC